MNKIITNNHVRETVYAWGVPRNIWRDQFSHYRGDDQEEAEGEYFCYRGMWYDLSEFTRLEPTPGWDGGLADSFFSGVVIRFAEDDFYANGTPIVVGTWFA